MSIHALAGKPAPQDRLIDIGTLCDTYFALKPDVSDPAQRVSFGTSGHRGSALRSTFNEAHVLAISQAICDYRGSQGISGPLFLGRDTHALSEPALISTLEVLAANAVAVMIDRDDGYTPTPAISHAILSFNRGRSTGLADGIVITPSHNPPEDGGFKYNPPHGGPADTDITRWIEDRANQLLAEDLRSVKRVAIDAARRAAHAHDYVGNYVDDLAAVVDMDAIRGAGLKIGADPLGGAGVAYWQSIVERYGVAIDIVNTTVDPAFAFMTLDWDGKIRMDCSSPYAMAKLIGLKDRFDLAFGNDTDHDRHGIVTRAGLLNPNHYLAAAIHYLFTHRPHWRTDAAIGKTVVSSSIIDRVATRIGRRLVEVPVGFKWFVDGLHEGSMGFGGEESAGAAFLRRDGTVWTTDKDGIILDLLAAEICAKTGRDPSQLYQQLEDRFGKSYYTRVDAPASNEQKLAIKSLDAKAVTLATLAGEPVDSVMTTAPGNNAAIGGVKVTARNSWFALRPSGTEAIYKIYAESFISEEHLQQVLREVKQFVTQTLG